MNHSHYKSSNYTPYFYYPKVRNRYCLLSYEEVDEVKNREGGELLFVDLKMSFSEEEAEENYKKVENFLAESMNDKEKKVSSNYSNIEEKRVLKSSIDEKYWVSAILDVWSLNCNSKNFDVKVGHKVENGYSVLMYRKKGGFLMENTIDIIGKKRYEKLKIKFSNIGFGDVYSFESGKYKYSLEDDYFEIRSRSSKYTPLVIDLESGNTYGDRG